MLTYLNLYKGSSSLRLGVGLRFCPVESVNIDHLYFPLYNLPAKGLIVNTIAMKFNSETTVIVRDDFFHDVAE